MPHVPRPVAELLIISDHVITWRLHHSWPRPRLLQWPVIITIRAVKVIVSVICLLLLFRQTWVAQLCKVYIMPDFESSWILLWMAKTQHTLSRLYITTNNNLLSSILIRDYVIDVNWLLSSSVSILLHRNWLSRIMWSVAVCQYNTALLHVWIGRW